MATLNLKNLFSTCREKFCSINGAPVGRLLDECMRQERAMLAQAETRSKAPFGNHNGRPDKSNGLDPQCAKLKKELTLEQREAEEGANACTERDIKSQEPTTPSQGDSEHCEGTYRARFQEQEG